MQSLLCIPEAGRLFLKLAKNATLEDMHHFLAEGLSFGAHRVVIAADRLHLLNPSAALIWSAWRDGLPAETIARRLADKYAIPLPLARQDVGAALDAWRCSGPIAPACSALPSERFPRPLPAMTNAPAPMLSKAIVRDYRLGAQAFRIQSNAALLMDSAAPLYAHLAAGSREPPESAATFTLEEENGGFRLWRGGHCLSAGADPQALLLALFQELVDFGYLHHDWLLAVHAAGVHNGRAALLFPALGGSGKTTLTAALLAAGCGYLSDDVVPLAGDGLQAIAVPVALRIKPGSVAALRNDYPGLSALTAFGPMDYPVRFLPPRFFDLAAAARHYPVAALVFPAYTPGAACRLTPINGVEALQRLIAAETLFHRPLIRAHIERVLHWLDQTPAYRLQYSRLPDAVGTVRELLPWP